MNKELLIIRLDGLVSAFKKLDNICSQARDIGVLSPCGEFDEIIWNAFEAACSALDADDWISWYLYETHCGEIEREVTTSKGEVMIIRNTTDLAELLISEY